MSELRGVFPPAAALVPGQPAASASTVSGPGRLSAPSSSALPGSPAGQDLKRKYAIKVSIEVWAIRSLRCITSSVSTTAGS